MTELETQLLAAFEQQQGLLEQLQRDYGQALSELQQQLLALSESKPRKRSQPPAGQSPCATCRNGWSVVSVIDGGSGEKEFRRFQCLLGSHGNGRVLQCSQFEP